MIGIPPELLVEVLTYLNCLEMVKTRQVSKRFLKAVDSTSSLFHSLVLQTSDRWRSQEDFKALEYFIEKSCCSLKHIHISRATMSYFPALPDYHSKLASCKCSLKSLEIGRLDFSQYSSLLELAFTCPSLEILQLCYLTALPKEKRVKVVRRRRSQSLEWEDENDKPRLKTLHLSNFFSNFVEDQQKLHFISGLTSLSLESVKPNDLRTLLQLVSPTLRHLRMVGFSSELAKLSTITLPQVQALEVTPAHSFPNWIHLPNCQTLMLEDVDVESDLDGLPSSINELWLLFGNRSYSSRYEYLNFIKLLKGRRFPDLVSLKFGQDVGVEANQLFEILVERNPQGSESKDQRESMKPIGEIVLDVERLEKEVLHRMEDFSVRVTNVKDAASTLEMCEK